MCQLVERKCRFGRREVNRRFEGKLPACWKISGVGDEVDAMEAEESLISEHESSLFFIDNRIGVVLPIYDLCVWFFLDGVSKSDGGNRL